MPKIKTQMTACTREDVEQYKHSSIAGRIVNLYNHFGKHSVSSSENWGIVIPQDPDILILGIYAKDVPTIYEYSSKYCHSRFIKNSQKLETTYISLSQRMNKELLYIYTLEYYSPI